MFCGDCRRKIGVSEPRIVVAGWYVCQECAYKREKGQARADHD